MVLPALWMYTYTYTHIGKKHMQAKNSSFLIYSGTEWEKSSLNLLWYQDTVTIWVTRQPLTGGPVPFIPNHPFSHTWRRMCTASWELCRNWYLTKIHFILHFSCELAIAFWGNIRKGGTYLCLPVIFTYYSQFRMKFRTESHSERKQLFVFNPLKTDRQN